MNEVSLTEPAAKMAKSLQEQTPDFADKPLRLYLDGKGCDGFYYGVTFDEPSDSDLRFVSHDIEIVVDPETLTFVKGASIDWVDDERGQGFLVDNPNHRKFRGKFFKRKSWQDKLTQESSQNLDS